MIGGSLLSWLAVTGLGGWRFNPELALGMAGPLASAVGTWIAVARTHAVAPERVTGVLIAGFAAKLLFFAGYVALVAVFGLRPGPFVISFTTYFVALLVVEAAYLRQLFAGPGTTRAGAAGQDMSA